MMVKDKASYFYKEMPDKNFLVDIFEKKHENVSTIFNTHWHEHLQFLYVKAGEALLGCESKKIHMIPEDFVVINSNELHYMDSLCKGLNYYIIRVDLSVLFSSTIDSCQTKFLLPMEQNLISFKNLIRKDKEVIECANKIIYEYFSRKVGFEFAIKSYLLKLFVILIRNYIEKTFSKEEYIRRMNRIKRLDFILKYIEGNFTDKITVQKLAEISHVSIYHFCRLFKKITGKTLIEYVNELRINKAILLLRNEDLNITEIALNCGFSDANYFSRIFKKYKGISPSEYQKRA